MFNCGGAPRHMPPQEPNFGSPSACLELHTQSLPACCGLQAELRTWERRSEPAVHDYNRSEEMFIGSGTGRKIGLLPARLARYICYFAIGPLVWRAKKRGARASFGDRGLIASLFPDKHWRTHYPYNSTEELISQGTNVCCVQLVQPVPKRHFFVLRHTRRLSSDPAIGGASFKVFIAATAVASTFLPEDCGPKALRSVCPCESPFMSIPYKVGRTERACHLACSCYF